MASDNGKNPLPKPSPAKAEALARLLKDSLSKRRPRPWKPVLAILGGSIVILVFLAYWFYPRPRPAPLQVVALDILCTLEEEPVVRAQLLAPAEEETPRPMSGHTVVFHRLALPQGGGKAIEIVAKSDARGQASAAWPATKASLADFLVNHVEEENRNLQSDRGRIFAWPKDAPILIIDANETLTAEELDGAASAKLTRAAKEGWHIVYLALASEKPDAYRKARVWIATNLAKLPPGPTLGRPHFPDEDSAAGARRAALKSLKDRFPGQMLAVVKTVESAQISNEAGVRTILIGPGPAPAGVLQAPTWADVVVRLE